MNKNTFLAVLLAAGSLFSLASCDHDDPTLSPIDTSKVSITATVKELPNAPWLDKSQEMTVQVENISMQAPKGVVLRSVSLIANTGIGSLTLDEKPYSGDDLVFKVPLTNLQGRINFSVRGNLIKKDSRDAEIMIADNIQTIVFSEQPQFKCTAKLFVTVKATSTTGEVYDNSFEVTSGDASTSSLTIPVPQEKLYWQPSSGTASTIEVSLGNAVQAWSPNTTFDCSIGKIEFVQNYSDNRPSTLKLTIPNKPGALNAEKLQMYAHPTFYGTWEGVTIDKYSILYPFSIVEVE